AINGFATTGTPDRLIYGRWPTMSGSGWNYVATEGANADSDSATLYYFGYTLPSGIQIAPGQSFSRSIVIFTAGSGQTCGGFIPGTGHDSDVTICPFTCAAVGATATDDCTTNPAVALISTSLGAPTCLGNPCTSEFDVPGVYTYTWQATDNA